MTAMIRIGAVSYLNTRPLVFGLAQGLGHDRIRLSEDVPAVLADRMERGEIDVGLLPVIELARIPDLEIVPGLSISSRGPCRSVMLVTRRAPGEIASVGLDVESRTSNALVQVLCAHAWKTRPEFEVAPVDLDEALERHDAVLRIGDKALFGPLPVGAVAIDLGQVWDVTFDLPFVYAAWVARPGIVDRELYQWLHQSRRQGRAAIGAIADDYVWNGRTYPELSRSYLRENIGYRLGLPEIEGIKRFHTAAAELGLIDAAPEIRLSLTRWTTCHDSAASMETIP